jgi:purine catabolism regulator
VATLAELRLAIFPAAVELRDAPTPRTAGAPGPIQDIGWVRVLRARVPAFDALETGDVAILPPRTLGVIAPGEVEIDALVDALADAGAAGLLVPEADAEETPEWVIDALRRAATARGLTAFRVPGAEPVTLERSIIGFLLNRRAELDHQAARLETMLAELALGAAELDELVAAIAGFLGRAVALEGARGETVAIHAPADAPGAGAAVAAYLGGSRTAALRVSLPGAQEGAAAAPSGRLVLLGDRPASELERAAGPRIGTLLALELARSAAVRRAGDASRRETLPADGPPWVVLLARQLGTISEREALRAELLRLASRRQLFLRGNAESVEVRAVVGGEGEGRRALAGRIAEVLGRTVAISRPFDASTGRPAAESEARSTLDAAEALPDPPRVADASRLGAYRLVASLRSLPDGRRHAEELLAPLLAGPRDARRERLATLRAVLEHPGLQEAADALGIHRNTLAYRIRRIEAATGWQLADAELRLPLALAVRLVAAPEE